MSGRLTKPKNWSPAPAPIVKCPDMTPSGFLDEASEERSVNEGQQETADSGHIRSIEVDRVGTEERQHAEEEAHRNQQGRNSSKHQCGERSGPEPSGVDYISGCSHRDVTWFLFHLS